MSKRRKAMANLIVAKKMELDAVKGLLPTKAVSVLDDLAGGICDGVKEVIRMKADTKEKKVKKVDIE